jgi:LysM repeat protein
LLEQQWQTQGILLISDTLNQALVPASLGLSLDIPTAVEAAYGQGRTWETLQELLQGGQAHFTPAMHFDEATARRTLETLAPQYTVEPIPADIRLVDGQVEAVPATPGRALDVSATLAPLRQNPAQVLAEAELPLVMTTVPAERSDVSAVVNAANRLLAHTVQVSAYDPIEDETVTWQVTADEWNPWVSLWLDESQPDGFAWELNQEEALAALAARFDGPEEPRYLPAAEIGPAIIAAISGQSWLVSQPRLYHRPQPHTVQPGETLSSIGFDYGMPYPWLQAANPEVGDALTPGQVITIPSPDELLPLPVVENKRIVVSLSQQKTWVYEAGALKWEWPTSTGIKSSPTAPGIFQVQTHQTNAYAANWDLWMPDFMGIYRPVPSVDFMNGFHGFPTRNGSTLLWTGDLGHPVTFGCILLDSQNAAALFAWAEAGVVVEIQR